MKRADIDNIIGDTILRAFPSDGLKELSSEETVDSPVKPYKDPETGEFIENVGDPTEGFDPRYSWQDLDYLKDGATAIPPKKWRNVIRDDIQAVATFGIRDSVERIIGRPNYFDPVIANMDGGYYGGAVVRDSETLKEFVASGNPKTFTVKPYAILPFTSSDESWFIPKPRDEVYTGIKGCMYEVNATDAFEVKVAANLPIKDPSEVGDYNAMIGRPENYNPDEEFGGNTIEYGVYSENSNAWPLAWYEKDIKRLLQGDQINEVRIRNDYADYDVTTDCQWAEMAIKNYIAGRTFNGTYRVFSFVPKRDVYGCLVPNLVISTIPEIYPMNPVFGIRATGFKVSSLYTYSYPSLGSTDTVATIFTGFYRAYPTWGGRWWISTDDSDTGVTIFASRFSKNGENNSTSGAPYCRNLIDVAPVMYFRKGVQYYMNVTLHNSFICDPVSLYGTNGNGDSLGNFDSRITTSGFPKFPISRASDEASMIRGIINKLKYAGYGFLNSMKSGPGLRLMEYTDAQVPATPVYPYYPDKTYHENTF